MKTFITTKKKIIIIAAIIIASITAVIISILLYTAGRLDRALKAMDIEQKETVTKVLKIAKDDKDVLLKVANAYIDGGKNADAVPILWHILQNIDDDCADAKKRLINYYGDSTMATQVESVKQTSTDFKVMSEYNGIGYGGNDGVYCSDFDGLIRYKLSSARAMSFSAATGGVYVLDGADNCVKFISRDGARVELVKKDVREFIYFESYIYAIMLDGSISGSKEITLADGEIAASLREFDRQVTCNIYDEKYNLLRTEILN